MIDKEIAKRRMRLGSKLETVTKEVKREVLSKSEVLGILRLRRLISVGGYISKGCGLE
jgi:hypothetical protein